MLGKWGLSQPTVSICYRWWSPIGLLEEVQLYFTEKRPPAQINPPGTDGFVDYVVRPFSEASCNLWWITIGPPTYWPKVCRHQQALSSCCYKHVIRMLHRILVYCPPVAHNRGGGIGHFPSAFTITFSQRQGNSFFAVHIKKLLPCTFWRVPKQFCFLSTFTAVKQFKVPLRHFFVLSKKLTRVTRCFPGFFSR